MADAAIDNTASARPDRQRGRQAVRRRRAGRLPRSRCSPGSTARPTTPRRRRRSSGSSPRRCTSRRGSRPSRWRWRSCRCSAGCGCSANSAAARRRSGSAAAHRITGSLALLFTLPVAYHCLWSLGFNPGDGSGRRLWHSIFGCLFFGAFTTKVLVVRSRRMPGWALPAVGATLFTVLVLIWLTSSLWFFRTIGIEL